MTTITIHNYEAYYLDYTEGNLNKEDTTLLFAFLNKNPHLKIDSSFSNDTVVAADTTTLPNKEALKKQIDQHSAENYIIASIENVINNEDAIELQKYIENNEDAKALSDRYKKTILQKQFIVYPNKYKLKKRRAIAFYVYPLAGAAAIILFFMLLHNSSKEPQMQNAITIKTRENTPEKEIKSEFTNQINSEKNAISDAGKKQNKKTPTKKNKTNQPIATIEKDHANITETNIVTLLNKIPEKIDTTKNTDFTISNNHNLATLADSTHKKEIANSTDYNKKANNDPTLLEFAANTLKNKLLNKTSENNRGNSLVHAVAKRIRKFSDKNIVYKHNKDNNSTNIHLLVGEFEFYRSKTN